jgi:ubiquinone/menaquinone biosynthesis C-methylase UbiE
MDLVMRSAVVRAERMKILPQASGQVLEVGIGSGLNIGFYPRDIQGLSGVDPSGELWAMARRRAAAAPFPVELIGPSAESIPAADRTFDTVVTTWTLCTIPDAGAALAEMRRVLREDGRLLFIEHGRSPDAHVRAWQDRLTPLWRRIGGGCHLNRPIDALIREAGFQLEWAETAYAQGPKPWSYLYRGVARGG